MSSVNCEAARIYQLITNNHASIDLGESKLYSTIKKSENNLNM